MLWSLGGRENELSGSALVNAPPRLYKYVYTLPLMCPYLESNLVTASEKKVGLVDQTHHTINAQKIIFKQPL